MDPSSESWHVLDDLQRDVLFRSKASIRSRIRHLALGAFASDPKAQEKSKRAVRAYDMRSKLVHDGNLSDKELSEGFEVSKETLRLALTTRIRQLAGIE